MFISLSLNVTAQGYRLTFQPRQPKEGTYYLAQHVRDRFDILDSAALQKGVIRFEGEISLETGVYTLLGSDRKKLFDLMIDGPQKFSISFDEKGSNAGMKVKGSEANRLMYQYMAKIDWARARSKELKDDSLGMAALNREMDAFEQKYREHHPQYRFTQLLQMFRTVEVPDNLEDNEAKAAYFRHHFWDYVDLSDHSLMRTPQLFDKMNYYFFGLLYYQHADTITACAHRVLDRCLDDSAMLRYFLDFVVPKYERATKNIGWDQVYVNLVRDYYLAGHCPWATEADLYAKRRSVNFLSQSLIGAMGQELFMADTNQSPDARQWVSSHRCPAPYIILWFWDPDCHHCQEQSDELARLVDSLDALGLRRFEVYAVGYEADVPKWKRYLREHHMPFVNVGGTGVNIDYQEAYNVHGAPTMIILDPDRRIIMNKVLAVKNILGFIDRYEEEHPEMRTKVTPWMRYVRR